MDRITERYHQMIRINSVNGHERELAEYITEILENIGLENGANEYGHIDQVKSCIRIYTSFAKKILR